MLDRRDFLRAGALAAAGLVGGPLLAGCRDGGTTTSTPRSASMPAGTPTASPAVLEPFDSTRPPGGRTSLPRRVAWANTNEIGIFAALGAGMAAASRQVGLDYLTANAKGDAQTNADQIKTFLARGVAGMTIQPLEPTAQKPLMQQALDRGICVVGIINDPCVLQIAASQYEVGLQQGRAAAEYITDKLKGRATVFNANLNEIAPVLALRNKGVLTGLKEAGADVEVIDRYVAPANEAPDKVLSLVSTALQRNPDINVILGVDAFVLPAYRAFQQTNRLRDDMYFSSIDGDPAALDLVAKGGPYRASLAFAWKLMGYGMARFVADWADGKEIPRVLVAKTTLVNSPDAARSFLADAAAPDRVFADRARYEQYLPLLGNVSHATRELVWTSEYAP